MIELAAEMLRQRRKWAIYGPVRNIYGQTTCMAKNDEGSLSYAGDREDCELYVERMILTEALGKFDAFVEIRQTGK